MRRLFGILSLELFSELLWVSLSRAQLANYTWSRLNYTDIPTEPMKQRACHHLHPVFLARGLLLLLLLMPLSASWATGWTDFKLDVGDGYSIYKASSMDVCLSKPYGPGVCGSKESGVGPVSKYINAPGYILTRNLGRMKVTNDNGDEYEQVDTSKQYYFVVNKTTDEVKGPLSESEFLARPEIVALAPLDWQHPTNPNGFPGPITLLIVLVALVVLTIVALLLASPLIVIILLLVRRSRKRRRAKSNARLGGDTRVNPAQMVNERASATPES